MTRSLRMTPSIPTKIRCHFIYCQIIVCVLSLTHSFPSLRLHFLCLIFSISFWALKHVSHFSLSKINNHIFSLLVFQLYIICLSIPFLASFILSDICSNHVQFFFFLFLHWIYLFLCLTLTQGGSKEEKMIGSGFGIKFATDIIQVTSSSLHTDPSSFDVLIDDRINKSIGKRYKDHVLLGIPFVIILGKSIVNDTSIPKFELISNCNQKGEERMILTHEQILHFFRLRSLNAIN